MNHPETQSPAERIAMLTRPKKVPGQVDNLCPYGCQPANLTPVGYCRHLVGWTVDGETVEVRENVAGKYERTGVLIGVVEDTDKIVVSTPDRIDKQKNPCPTPYHRVYRKNGKAPYRDGSQFIVRSEKPELQYDDEELEQVA